MNITLTAAAAVAEIARRENNSARKAKGLAKKAAGKSDLAQLAFGKSATELRSAAGIAEPVKVAKVAPIVVLDERDVRVAAFVASHVALRKLAPAASAKAYKANGVNLSYAASLAAVGTLPARSPEFAALVAAVV